MAKKNKHKIEKETRQLIESTSELVKKKDSGDYKIKSKNKKDIKKVKNLCVHWVSRKKGIDPSVTRHPEKEGYWICKICGAAIPIKPIDENNPENMYHVFKDRTDDLIELVDYVQFMSVKLGGDAEDTKMLLQLKRLLPKFAKVGKQVAKQVKRREKFDTSNNSNNRSGIFDAYNTSYDYR